MKTKQMLMLTVVLLLAILPGREAQAFYNPASGHWLNRDPIDEPGHQLQARTAIGNFHVREQQQLQMFVQNDPINRYDKLGLRCCLITYAPDIWQLSPGGHSVLQCDNPPTYISFFPGANGSSGEWHNQDQDRQHFGNRPTTTTCFDCLDEGAVAQWFQNAQNGVGFSCDWTWGNNCADATGAAIGASLPQPQNRPKCPCSPDRFRRWEVRDLLQSYAAISWPSSAADRVNQLVDNSCQRYKCVLVLISTGQPATR